LVAIDQRLLWETDRSKFDNKIKELGDEVLAYAEQCKEYEEERDELVKELSKKQAEDASSMHIHQLLSIFSLSEIEEASRNFDPSVKIGEGGYGNIYKGFLRHTPVAIKMLNPESMQGHAVFKQEVRILEINALWYGPEWSVSLSCKKLPKLFLIYLCIGLFYSNIFGK
jgi:hypothetical protein